MKEQIIVYTILAASIGTRRKRLTNFVLSHNNSTVIKFSNKIHGDFAYGLNKNQLLKQGVQRATMMQQRWNTPGGIDQNKSIHNKLVQIKIIINIIYYINKLMSSFLIFFQYNINMIQSYSRQHHSSSSAINTLLFSVSFNPILVYFAIHHQFV